MTDRDVVVVNGSSKIGWFLAGGLLVAIFVAAFLYLNGFFDRSNTVELKVEVPEVTIPAN